MQNKHIRKLKKKVLRLIMDDISLVRRDTEMCSKNMAITMNGRGDHKNIFWTGHYKVK